MEEKKSSYGKRIIKLLIVLGVVVVLTNPAILPIWPFGLRNVIYRVWTNIFGDVDRITQVVNVNWIAIFQIILIILMMSIIYSFVKIILGKINPKTGKGKSLYSLVDSVLMYAVALITLVWSLNSIGVNMSTIFASIGIIALIVGFAAESLIEDLIVGVFLTFEDEFNVGDIIEYNGFRGEVVSIGMRVTSLKNAGGNVLIVNNSDIRTVLNRSKSKSVAICDVPVSYAADLESAEEIIKSIIKTMPEKYPEIFHEEPSYKGVQELASSSVNLRVVAPVDEAKIYEATRMLNREIKIGMDKADLEIPFTQVVVHQG